MRDAALPYFVSAALLAASTWWLAQILTPPPEVVEHTLAHEVDYYAQRFTRVETDTSGQPKTRLAAERMQHYEDDASSDLVKPTMQFYHPGVPPWVVNAETGVMSGDGNTVFLGGKTVAQRAAYANRNAIEAISRDVTVHLDQHTLDSAAYTEIFHHPNYTAGHGMHTEFADGMQIHLLSEVKGRYER